jgi:hypothetical protein
LKIPQFLYSTIEELQRFIALLVQQMQTALSDNGWQPPVLTNAMVAQITASTFLPVMQFGTFWANSDIGKLQFISAPAVAGISNATIQTITSV